MPATLSTTLTEQNTAKITVTFADENGDAVTPETLTWTLKSAGGTVINNREDVSVSPSGSSETIILSGDDLGVAVATGTRRILYVDYTYNSSNGTGLPGHDWVEFRIKDNPVSA